MLPTISMVFAWQLVALTNGRRFHVEWGHTLMDIYVQNQSMAIGRESGYMERRRRLEGPQEFVSAF